MGEGGAGEGGATASAVWQPSLLAGSAAASSPLMQCPGIAQAGKARSPGVPAAWASFGRTLPTAPRAIDPLETGRHGHASSLWGRPYCSPGLQC